MYCSKCNDERKYTRLELATWQGKIPIIVGIEEILKMMTTLDDPTNTLPEENEIIDWNEGYTYCLCDNKVNNPNSQYEPLDLSRFELPKPQRSVLPNSNYSERELISAVRAICCGRIGTRRAAALYGIPRSTLRNRIFKIYDAKKIHEGDEAMPMVDFFKKILKDDSMFSSVFQQKYQRENKEDRKRTTMTEKEIIKNGHSRIRDYHMSNKELFKNELNEVMKHHHHDDDHQELELNNDDFPYDPFNFNSNIPDIFNGFIQQSNHFQNLMTSYLFMMCQQNILSSVYGSLASAEWSFPHFDVSGSSLSKNECSSEANSPDIRPLDVDERDSYRPL